MIAILYKNNIIHMFVPDLISIDGNNVVGRYTAAKGTTADILVVDGFTYGSDGTGKFITNGSITLRPFGHIAPNNFTDTRNLLPKTAEEKKMNKITSDNEQMNLQIIELFEQLVEKGVL